MSFKEMSIQVKLICALVLLVVVCTVTLSQVAMMNLNALSDKQLTRVESALKENIEAQMVLNAEKTSLQVKSLLEKTFSSIQALATMLADTATPNHSLSRDEATQLAQSAMMGTPSASSTYAQFEANGYDGNDKAFTGVEKHSTPSGSFEVYWVKEASGPVMYPVDDPNEKYLSEKNEYGLREAEWYLCSMDSKKPCIADPYLYEIEPGNSELMTSLTVPVLVNGQFRGLVGMDINLPILQKWIDEYSNTLFSGKAELTLISQRQFVVASSEYPNKLGEHLSKIDTELKNVLERKDTLMINKGIWHVTHEFTIADTGVSWTLVVSLPETEALSTMHQMQTFSEDSVNQSLTFLVIFAVIFVIAAVLIAIWVARSIASPIGKVSQSVQTLATQEGDLTQSVSVDSHAELIALAKGLNAFIFKLADMIRQSKQSATSLVDDLNQLSDSANKVHQRTEDQQHQLDSIATAITEMSSSSAEVADLAANTAQHTRECNTMLSETQVSLNHNVSEVNSLASAIQSSAQNVNDVASKTEDITGILTTIGAIAEQTNLLALNAAIEAARAGEQGRGFAVVADEVRSLAARTQTSTLEISQLISELQQRVQSAVSALQSISTSVESTVSKTQKSYDDISLTMTNLEAINDSISQVATAAHQQSQVSEDINQRVVAVSDSSVELAELGNVLQQVYQHIDAQITQMDAQLSRLKV